MNILLLRLALISLAPVSCLGCDAPGKGEKAEQGKSQGDLLVQALGVYHSERGDYPEQLNELVPKYIVRVPASQPGNTDGVSFIYVRSSTSEYRLVFRYFGPGSNTCTHRPAYAPNEWKCLGAY